MDSQMDECPGLGVLLPLDTHGTQARALHWHRLLRKSREEPCFCHLPVGEGVTAHLGSTGGHMQLN